MRCNECDGIAVDGLNTCPRCSLEIVERVLDKAETIAIRVRQVAGDAMDRERNPDRRAAIWQTCERISGRLRGADVADRLRRFLYRRGLEIDRLESSFRAQETTILELRAKLEAATRGQA